MSPAHILQHLNLAKRALSDADQQLSIVALASRRQDWQQRLYSQIKSTLLELEEVVDQVDEACKTVEAIALQTDLRAMIPPQGAE